MARPLENPGSEGRPAADATATATEARPRAPGGDLAEQLDRFTTAGTVCRTEGERIRCLACGHRCLIGPGHRGVCKVRFNLNGQLRVPYGYVAGLHCDPVEKKPFFHVYPGCQALTFGMLGCDFHCSYCQNWITSQAFHEPIRAPFEPVSPAQIVAAGRRAEVRLVVSSYNEPLITAEWAVAVFQQARAQNMRGAFVSNGNATAEVLDFLRPWLIAYKVDLKSFSESRYRLLGGQLKHVTQTIQRINELGLWLEVVTLLVPGFNDDAAELRALTQFLSRSTPIFPGTSPLFTPITI
jgi:pyruvate formate lyase activating enzyme